MAEPADNLGELVVVTGMTGAGRSTAAKELEDLGFFVVDNLPPELVADMVRLIDDKQGIGQPIAAIAAQPPATSRQVLQTFQAAMSRQCTTSCRPAARPPPAHAAASRARVRRSGWSSEARRCSAGG